MSEDFCKHGYADNPAQCSLCGLAARQGGRARRRIVEQPRAIDRGTAPLPREALAREIAASPRPDGPGAPAPTPASGGSAPRPNPAPAAAEQRALLPTTRTAAPVEEQIADILAITGQQVAKYKGRQDALGLRELQALEALARTIKLTHELDKEVRAGLEEEFGKQDDEALRQRAAELAAQARR